MFAMYRGCWCEYAYALWSVVLYECVHVCARGQELSKPVYVVHVRECAAFCVMFMMYLRFIKVGVKMS